MWNNKQVTVGIITRNNGATIRNVIEDVFYTGFVDEVIVTDVSSRDRTISEISYTKARMLSVRNHVDAFNQIMDKSNGDYVIFLDPRGYIPGTEVPKLLPYSLDSNAVFTSRVTWLGSDVPKSDKKYLRNNRKLGENISKRLATVNFNDVNSSLFLLRKSFVSNDKFKFFENQDFFVFEAMMNSFQHGFSHIQIPCEFHSSLEETDARLFSSPINIWKMRKAISLLEKSFKRKIKIRYEDNNIIESINDNEDDHINPILIKKRITELRKRLGATDDSIASQEVKKKLDGAVNKIRKSSVKEKLTLEEEYAALEKLEAGLSRRKLKTNKKKKGSNKNANN